MTKPVAPVVCSPDIARCIGANFYAEPPDWLGPPAATAFIATAAQTVSARGLLPVLTHGRGAVWAWPLDPDAHRRR